MEKIIKSREILSSIKTELEKLEQKIGEFSQYNIAESFIPIDLCASTAMALQKISAYEESLFEKLGELSQTPVIGIADAEKIINDAEIEQERKLLSKRFSGIKTSNPKYQDLIEMLTLIALEGDLNSPERTIADLLVADLINGTKETSKNELVENSDYYKLAFAFNRNEIYYQQIDNDPDDSDSTVTAQENENTEDHQDSPAETEPPPISGFEEENKDEIALDIDLSKNENFAEGEGLDLSLSINAEEPEISEPALDLSNPNGVETTHNEKENNIDEENSTAKDEITVSEEIQPIVDEYKEAFVNNPSELALKIEEAEEADIKNNVTEIMNMLSPKGRSARSPVKVYQVILSELLLYGPKTEDDLYELPDFFKNRISNSVVDGYLEKLYSKGIISRINFDGNVLYYFTQKGLKLNNHDRIIFNFYCCSDKRTRSNVTKKDCRKVYPISNFSVCSSVILSKIVKKYPYYLAIGSSDISVEGLSISVISKPNIRNFALSYVSDDASKLDKLYDNLNKSFKALEVFEKLDTLIVGSYTRTQAQAVYKVVEKSWKEKLGSTKVIFYAYNEDKYFDSDTFEEIEDFENLDKEENNL